MSTKTPEAGDTFQHQNGHEYAILAIARDDYTEQDLVIHRGLHDGRIWSRPMTNFTGMLEGLPRFVHTGGLMTPAEPQDYQPIRSTMSG